MKQIDQELEEIFKQLKECHSTIHQIKEKPNKEQLIYKLHESCELCIGAFYQLFLYQKYYNDLDNHELNKSPHTECWNILDNTSNFLEFTKTAIPPNDSIHSELRSMSIANAAFRISSAGALICDIVKESIVNRGRSKTLYNKMWPYQKYLKNESNWDRAALYKNLRWGDQLIRFLLLVIALRDEYAHSEYSFQADKYREERVNFVEKYYKKEIIGAELTILNKILGAICKLCQLHRNGSIDLNENFNVSQKKIFPNFFPFNAMINLYEFLYRMRT
jgi:hypothetical protein